MNSVLSAGIDIDAEEVVLIIRKDGKISKLQASAYTIAGCAQLQKRIDRLTKEALA